MTLPEQILSIYPELTEADFLGGAIVLRNEGAGDYIHAWNHALPRPTQAQLDAATPRARVPQVVSRFQAKAAMARSVDAAGVSLLSKVEAMMADAATPLQTRLAWQDAQEFRRTSPTVLQMGAALGLDAAALDALFTTAAGIEA